MLSLLVALLSVSAVLVPIVANSFKPDTAKIQTTLLSSGPTQLKWGREIDGLVEDLIADLSYPFMPAIAVNNTGERSGIFIEVCFEGKILLANITNPYQDCQSIDAEEALIEPGKVRIYQPKGEFMLSHPELPNRLATVKNGQQVDVRVGPINLEGELKITFQNSLGVPQYETHEVKEMDFFFTR